jgi:hypothetical protein
MSDTMNLQTRATEGRLVNRPANSAGEKSRGAKRSFTTDPIIIHSLRQIFKAVRRGDYNAADNWSSILERQLFCAVRISSLARREHRSRKLESLPPKPPASAETSKFGRNPVVWPSHWTPETIAKVKRDMSSQDKREKTERLRKQQSAPSLD